MRVSRIAQEGTSGDEVNSGDNLKKVISRFGPTSKVEMRTKQLSKKRCFETRIRGVEPRAVERSDTSEK